jgi:hypothetical protein
MDSCNRDKRTGIYIKEAHSFFAVVLFGSSPLSSQAKGKLYRDTARKRGREGAQEASCTVKKVSDIPDIFIV